MGFIKKNWQALTLLIIGAFCTGIGIICAEYLIVLRKAAAICLECIGIG
jgi:hypothetical protein